MSDATDLVANAKQNAKASTWGMTPRQLANTYDPENTGQWARPAIEKAALEVGQKHPSRSAYRASDAVVDTWAGMDLNTNAAVHEMYTESAATYGDPSALAVIRKKADAGYSRAQQFLAHLTAPAPRAVAAPAVQRSIAGLTDSLPTSWADFFTPARRGTVHWVITTLLAILAVTVTQVSGDTWALWTPLVAGVALAGFDLGVSIFHATNRIRLSVYGLILAVQPIALLLHWLTDAQWTAIAPLLAAVAGGALAAAKTPKW